MTFLTSLKHYLLKKIAGFFIKTIIFSCQKEIRGEENLTELKKNKIPIIFVQWHRHIFFHLEKFKNSGVRPLVSLSEDGELISQIAREFKIYPVRGSSSKGGTRAFLKILDLLKTGKADILFTADGPRGPARQVKDGTIVLSQKSGAVLIPVSWYASSVKILEKTWDKFLIPRPFSKIISAYGPALKIPQPVNSQYLAIWRKELKKALDNLEYELIEECRQK